MLTALLRVPKDSPWRHVLRLPIVLGLIGVFLCFGLPHGPRAVDLGFHILAAALVVVALALAMAEEAGRDSG